LLAVANSTAFTEPKLNATKRQRSPSREQRNTPLALAAANLPASGVDKYLFIYLFIHCIFPYLA
jgi:hypothetical protein